MSKNNVAIPKILEKYLNYLVAVKGCSAHTVKAFSSDIMQFFSFIEKYKEILIPVKEFNVFVLKQVEEKDIIAFLVYLNFNKDNSPYTRQRKVTALRSFYKWLFCIFTQITDKQNPTSGLAPIKKIERLPKHLNLSQTKEILKVFNHSNTRFPERNNTIISLFLSTGMRLSELININFGDVNFDDKSIVIFGKNSKERIVYFNDNCKKLLLKYLNLRKMSNEKINYNSPLFLNKLGNRIGTEGVQNICEKAYKLIGIEEKGYTTHTLRHTAATIIYTYVKDDIILVKQFLGHASLSSTEIYTHIHNAKIKEAVDSNPLNNYKREGSACN